MVKLKRITTEQYKVGISNRYLYLYNIVPKRPTGDDIQPYEAKEKCRHLE